MLLVELLLPIVKIVAGEGSPSPPPWRSADTIGLGLTAHGAITTTQAATASGDTEVPLAQPAGPGALHPVAGVPYYSRACSAASLRPNTIGYLPALHICIPMYVLQFKIMPGLRDMTWPRGNPK